MILPQKFYDTLKFLVSFVPYVVTIVTGILMAVGIADGVVAIVSLCIGAVGSIADAIIKAASKAHWKKVAEDGTLKEIEDAEFTENSL